MTGTDTENINNNPENDARGRRVTDRVRNTIIETFLDLVREGKKSRGLSAAKIESRIYKNYPDIAESLPTWQSINNIVKKHRDSLSEDANLDMDWSLSLWMRNPYNIEQNDLPLIIEIQQKMALDTEKLSAMNFRENRLTVREARWVGPVNTVLSAEDVKDSSRLSTLTELVRRYALRERVIGMTDESNDSYDIDMELAFKDPHAGLASRDSELLESSNMYTLYTEMGLIPHKPKTREGRELEEIESDIETSDLGSDSWELSDEDRISDEGIPVKVLLGRMLANNVKVKVTFQTTDWNKPDGVKNRDSYSSFESSGEYNINQQLLNSLWPLIKWDGELVAGDPKPVKVATAFWNKIEEKVRELAEDPKVKTKIGHTRPILRPPLDGMLTSANIVNVPNPDPLLPSDEE